MGWLDLLRLGSRASPAREDTTSALPPPLVRSAPGVAALFEGLREDGSHAVLDLGPATESQLHVFGRFARQVRFADLITAPPHGEAWSAALRGLPPHPHRPYDLVFAWNVLDRIRPEARPSLIERLAELTAPAARLHIVVDLSGAPFSPPLRFTVVDVDRVHEEAVGAPEATHAPLLPAEVERLVRPFVISRAFTLRSGMREYVAVKR